MDKRWWRYDPNSVAWARRGRHGRGGGAYLGGGRFVLWAVDYWGMPGRSCEVQLDPRGGLRFCQELSRIWGSLMLRKSELNGRGGVGGKVTDPAFAKAYPVLFDHLTQTEWEDGSSRVTSTLGIYPDGGTIRVMLRDRAMGVCCWVAVPAFSLIWETLEAALRDPTHEWRADRAVAPTASRKQAPPTPVDKRGRKR